MEFPPLGPVIAEGLTIVNAQGVTVAKVDTNGNAVFQNVNARSITLDGFDLETFIENTAQGLLSLSLSPTTVGPTVGNAALQFGASSINISDAPRFYEVGYIGDFDTGGSHPAYVRVQVKFAQDRPAISTDPLLFETQYPLPVNALVDTSECVFQLDSSYNGHTLNTAFFFNTDVSGTSYIGKGYSRCWSKDLGANGAITTFVPSAPPVQQYVKTYTNNGTHVFQGDGTNRDAYAAGSVFQGQYSGTNGNQFSIINFDYATIASDLSGATINKVEVFLTNQHWYYNSGGTAIVGYANSLAGSGNYNYSNVTSDVNSFSGWGEGSAKWVTVNNSVGTAFQNGSAHALALGKGPSTSLTYYGYFAGSGQSGQPQLRITYTK